MSPGDRLVAALSAWADSYWCKTADLPRRDDELYDAWSRLTDADRQHLAAEQPEGSDRG